jgi:hypothetical protein
MDAVDPGSAALTQYREVSMRDVLDSYDIVKAQPAGAGGHGYVIVAERSTTLPTIQLANPANIELEPALREIGYASTSPWTGWTREELIPGLRDKLGTRKYYDMKRNDGAVRGSLLLLKTPIRAAHWYIEPGEDTTLAHNIANFVHECLFDELNVDFGQVLDDILLMFEYGYMVLEKVYKFRRDGKVGLRKLAPRHPLDIREWNWDDRGGPAGITMEPFLPNPYLRDDTVLPPFAPGQRGTAPNYGDVIPINKLVVFPLEAEAGDLRGTSVLRSAYKHWFYKDTLYKIDAIQKERHGIGIPVIKLPPGYSETDKSTADELGRNLRTNDRAHIVIPANWEIMFAKLEGQPVSAIESINHHDGQIKINIVAPFMDSDTPDDTSTDIFFKSTRYLANSIASIFNKHVIRQLVDLNFTNGKYPKLRARRIGEWNDLRTLSFAIRNFVGAGLITPDDVLEAQLREEADLPHQDFATSRAITQGPSDGSEGGDPITGSGRGGDANRPQLPRPGRAGMPRQTPPGANPQRGNSGRDSSGG